MTIDETHRGFLSGSSGSGRVRHMNLVYALLKLRIRAIFIFIFISSRTGLVFTKFSQMIMCSNHWIADLVDDHIDDGYSSVVPKPTSGSTSWCDLYTVDRICID